jgi:hypothetical protein
MESGEKETRMKGIRISGLCALALAASAIIASSASAVTLPEFGRCVKVARGTGVYRGAACVTKETGTLGTYNWVPASSSEKQTFTGSGLESTFTSAGHPTIKCLAANFTGEYTGPKTASVTIEFQACVNSLEQQCQSNPQNKSEIKTLPLEAEVGFIKNQVVEGKPIIVAGLDLKPTPPLTDLAMYECGGGGPNESAHLQGSVIGSIKPINKMTTEQKLSYLVRKSGEQYPEQFEGGLKDTLSTTFTAGLESTTVPTTLNIKSESGHNAAPIEIKAREN